MSEMRGYAAAQRAYDNMAPPEDGPSECPECEGVGQYPGEDEPCITCCGTGLIDEDGNPFDPNAAEEAAGEYADMKREDTQ